MKRQINSANWPCRKDQQEEQTSEQVENGLMVLFLCNTNKDNSMWNVKIATGVSSMPIRHFTRRGDFR